MIIKQKTNQFWSGLILTVPVPQTSVPALAPGVQFPVSCDTGTVGPSCCYVHHFLPSQGIDHPWSVTGTTKNTKTFNVNSFVYSINFFLSTLTSVWNSIKLQTLNLHQKSHKDKYLFLKTKKIAYIVDKIVCII